MKKKNINIKSILVFTCVAIAVAFFLYLYFFQKSDVISKRNIFLSFSLGLVSSGILFLVSKKPFENKIVNNRILAITFLSTILFCYLFRVPNNYLLAPEVKLIIGIPSIKDGGKPIEIKSIQSEVQDIWFHQFPKMENISFMDSSIILTPFENEESTIQLSIKTWDRVYLYLGDVAENIPITLKLNDKTEIYRTPDGKAKESISTSISINDFWKIQLISKITVILSVFCTFYFIVFYLWEDNRWKKLSSNLGYELIIFSYLIIELFLFIPETNRLDPWPLTSYGISYDLVGFSSRAVIGSILTFLQDPLQLDFVYKFILFTHIVNSALLAFMLGKMIRKTTNPERYVVLILIALFLVNPTSISSYSKMNFERLDIYLILLSMISILFLKKKNCLFLIPVIGFISIAIHQVYFFTYFVFIFILLLFEVIHLDFEKIYIYTLSIFSLVVVVSFIYFQFFKPGVPVGGLEVINEKMIEKLDFGFSQDMIQTEYFGNIEYHIETYVKPSLDFLIDQTITTFIFLSPIIFIIYWLFFRMYHYTASMFEKIMIIIIILTPLSRLPLLPFTIDWGRWISSTIICQFGIIFYLIYSGYLPLKKTIGDFEYRIRNTDHYLLFLLILVLYLGRIGKMGKYPLLSETYTILNNMREFLGL